MNYLSTARPFGHSYHLADEIFSDKPFDNLFFPFAARPKQTKQTKQTKQKTVTATPADIYQTDSGYTIELEVPGISKEAISIDIEDGVLKVDAEVSAAETGDNVVDLRRERYRGTVKRSFTLSEEIDEESIAASLDNGILTIKLARREPVEEKVRRIEVN